MTMAAPKTVFEVRRNAREAPCRILGFRAPQVQSFIEQRVAETGEAPSYEEIRQELGFYDRAGVKRVVDGLERGGFVYRQGCGRQRRIRLA